MTAVERRNWIGKLRQAKRPLVIGPSYLRHYSRLVKQLYYIDKDSKMKQRKKDLTNFLFEYSSSKPVINAFSIFFSRAL